MQLPSGATAPQPARVGRTLESFYFLSFGALGLHAPYFPLWLEAHGFTGLTMSAIAALTPAMSFIGPPLVGALADARGARGNLLTLACALASFAMLALSMAEALGVSRWFPVVFGVALVVSIAAGVSTASIEAAAGPGTAGQAISATELSGCHSFNRPPGCRAAGRRDSVRPLP